MLGSNAAKQLGFKNQSCVILEILEASGYEYVSFVVLQQLRGIKEPDVVVIWKILGCKG